MLSDLQIAQQAEMRPIIEVAEEVGILREELELHGDHMAKVKLGLLDRLADKPDGKLVLVTAITPTPLGEGKTVINIGLTEALRHIGKNAIVTIREPSMGPTFGIKGGACGGGNAQVVPMENINLHFTGDIHAVGAATNLLAAMIGGHLWHKNPLNIDPFSISWNRVIDMNDVALRSAIVGLGGKGGGIPRETQFDITVASEVMAILALTSGLQDIRERLGRIQIGVNKDREPVTAEDLKAGGAMAVLMKDAIKPNLVQALDGRAAFVHAGPFANIAVGTNSVLADKIALKLADYVTTEAGFGADCGAEKFLDIKCRVGGLKPSAVVIVASVRALQLHGGAFTFKPGTKPPQDEFEKENIQGVVDGAPNLIKHIENCKLFGLPVVVALNRFPTDTDGEIAAVKEAAESAGADAAVETNVWAEGGAGGGRRVLRHRRDQDQALREAGPGQSAHLHGQDPPLAQPRSRRQGPAHRLHRADRGHPPLRGRGLPLPAVWRRQDHARPAYPTRCGGRGPGRGGQRRRPVLRSDPRDREGD